MNMNENPPCDRADMVRDYAFDELAQTERKSVEQHLTTCSDCAAELDRLRLTTAALRVLPDLEVPRRIAFVSDKVFEQGWLGGKIGSVWNSAARLGFASACVLAVGLSFAAWHRPPEVRTVVQTTDLSKTALDQTVAEAVNKAVAMAVERTHAEDVQLTKAALDAVDSKYEQKQRNLMIAMQENLDVVRKHLLLNTTYAMMSSDTPRMGAGQ